MSSYTTNLQLFNRIFGAFQKGIVEKQISAGYAGNAKLRKNNKRSSVVRSLNDKFFYSFNIILAVRRMNLRRCSTDS